MPVFWGQCCLRLPILVVPAEELIEAVDEMVAEVLDEEADGGRRAHVTVIVLCVSHTAVSCFTLTLGLLTRCSSWSVVSGSSISGSWDGTRQLCLALLIKTTCLKSQSRLTHVRLRATEMPNCPHLLTPVGLRLVDVRPPLTQSGALIRARAPPASHRSCL